MAGTPAPFDYRAEYDSVVDALFATGSIDDPARLYWDLRPSANFPTLEFRVSDVGLSVDDAVLVAGSCGRPGGHCDEAEAGAAPRVRPELLRAATWRAARHGIGATSSMWRRGGRARPGADRPPPRPVRPALEDLGTGTRCPSWWTGCWPAAPAPTASAPSSPAPADPRTCSTSRGRDRTRRRRRGVARTVA